MSTTRPAVLAVLLSLLVSAPLAAATITVNDAADYDFGSSPSNSDGTGCTLRKAIANANNNAQTFTACAAGSGSSNTIVFNVGGGPPTITLGTLGSPLFVNRSLTIQGPATIDGSQENDIFRVSSSGVTFAIDGLTLKNAANSAVKIFSSNSSFHASNCLFEDNSVPGSGGGAISSSGPIQINLCAFVGNSSNGSSDGGGAIRLSSSDPSTISNSSFINNSSKTTGGAIHYSSSGNLSALLIDNVAFLGNSAEADGGASQGGGAIWHQNGLLTVLNSVFAGNEVEGDEGRGGAMYLALGAPVALLEHNLFTLNKAKGDDGLGGAIFSARAAIVSGNTFISNSADFGGAIASTAKIKGGFNTTAPGFMLANSTLHDNSARRGGGIYSMGPETGSVERGITLINVTLDGNEASDSNGGGGLYSAEVQSGRAPEADVRNSILSNNTANGADDNCNSNAAIPIQNGGGNLLSHAGTCSASPVIAEVGDPRLALPTLNPVPPTLSMALQAGSRAVQIGLPSVCEGFPIFNLDQRFFPRPSPDGTACDAGAYEAEIGPPAPGLDVTPNAGLAFGSVAVNTSASLLALVTNTGTLPLESLALQVTGTGFSLVGTSCGSSLAAGEACSANISFLPTNGEARIGQFSASGAGGLSDAILLTGSGFVATPGLNLSPDAGLHFGDQQAGSSSAFLEANLHNTGNIDLTGISFSVAAPFQLSAGGSCGSSLAQGANCTQRVVFAPVAAGPFNASLQVSSTQGPNDVIPLSGRGTTPAALSLAPSEGFDFGLVEADTFSGQRRATLTNTGTEPAFGVGFAFVGGSNGFELVGHDCPINLLGGLSCHADLRYAPSLNSTGSTAQFRGQGSFLFSNQISLVGSAYRPARLRLAPDDGRDFGLVQSGTTSSPLTISVRNEGQELLVDIEVSVGAPFAIVSAPCPASLAPGAGCSVEVVAAPSIDGAASASLSARGRSSSAPADNPASLQTATAPLRVLGFTPGDLVVAPAQGLAFGAVPVGSVSAAQTLSLFNPGSRLVHLNSVSSNSPLITLSDSTCGSSLPGGASCSLLARFAPGGPGPLDAQFTAVGVRADDFVPFPLSRSVPLTGSGFTPTPDLRFEPAAGLDFGSVASGTSSPSQSLQLVNQGAGSANYQLSLPSGSPFQITGGSCSTQAGGSSLGGGQSCSIALVFAPLLGGPFESILSANSEGVAQQASLRGTGFDPAQPKLRLDPPPPGPLRFAVRVGQSQTQSLVVSNIGTGQLSVGQPALSGLGAGDFLLLTPLPIDLAGGQSQSLQVACQPTSVGPRTALLGLQSTDPSAASVSIALDCEGVGTLFGDGFEPDSAALIP